MLYRCLHMRLKLVLELKLSNEYCEALVSIPQALCDERGTAAKLQPNSGAPVLIADSTMTLCTYSHKYVVLQNMAQAVDHPETQVKACPGSCKDRHDLVLISALCSVALQLQALCDERGTAVKQLELQVALLNEKVQLLTAELNQQEQDNRNLMSDLQQRLDRYEGSHKRGL